MNVGGRKEHTDNGNEPLVTQAVQDAVKNMVGKAAKGEEHEGVQPVV